MRTRFTILAIGLAVVLTACNPAPAPEPSTASPSASAPSPSPSESVAPPEVEMPKVIISIDGLTNGDASVGFNDGTAVFDFLANVLGETPVGVPDPSGYPSTSYEWDGIRLDVGGNGATVLRVDEGAADAALFTTPEDISIGSSVDDALAAGAEDPQLDGDGDGQNDTLWLGVEEVPGTVPYEDPDGVGSK